MTRSPLGSLSVSSEQEFVHNDQTSLMDDDEEGGYGFSYPSEVDLSSPSFDLQRSSQYSSTINSLVLHYKSHGGATPTSKQDSDSIHSSNYTKSVNSQGGMKEYFSKIIELNRIIAANSYVSEVLEGDVEEQSRPLNLIPTNWINQGEIYSRVFKRREVELRLTLKMLKICM